MKADTNTVATFEAAVLLWSKLGNLRGNWSDFLSDCIRSKTSLNGLTLLPCAKRHDGRMSRPIYSVDDINDFVAKVKARIPSAGRTPIKPAVLAIDTGKGWRNNKFDKTGAPMMCLASAQYLQLTGRQENRL